MTAWVTIAELAAHTGRTDLDFHVVGNLYLEAACQCIREFIDQQVDYEADDEIRIAGTGTETLVLPEMPIVEVVSIFKDDDTEPVDPTTYEVQGRSRVVLLSGIDKWLSTSWYTVIYSHGWALTAEDADPGPPPILQVPPTLRMRALEVASVGLVAGRTGLGGVRSEQIGRYNYEMQSDTSGSASVLVGLSDEQMTDLRSYRQGDVA